MSQLSLWNNWLGLRNYRFRLGNRLSLRSNRLMLRVHGNTNLQMIWLSLRSNRLSLRSNQLMLRVHSKNKFTEWQFCMGLHLHPGGRPLFILGCRCRSRNDWACSEQLGISCTTLVFSTLSFMELDASNWRRSGIVLEPLSYMQHVFRRIFFQTQHMTLCCLNVVGNYFTYRLTPA